MREFEERIKLKNSLEDEMLDASVRDLANAVTGGKVRGDPDSGAHQLSDAIEEIGRALRLSVPPFSGPGVTEAWFQEEVFRPNGIMWREVSLKDDWYNCATGVMLGSFSDGRPVVLLPAGNGHYRYRDPVTGKKNRITGKNAGCFNQKATLYYKALPSRKLDGDDIRQFIRELISLGDVLSLLLATLSVILLSMVTPALTRILMSDVLQQQSMRLLLVILTMLILVTASSFFLTSVKKLILSGISSKVAIPFQAAFMMRVLTSPAGKLKHYAAGDLGSRIGSLYNGIKKLMNMFYSLLLTALCSLISYFQMFRYAKGPAWTAVGVTAVLVLLTCVVIKKQEEVSADRMKDQAEESGLTYRLIDGMQKITTTGAEKRAFSVWTSVFRKSVQNLYDPPLLLKIYQGLIPAILLAGTIIMYLTAARTGVSQADFYAFLSSYSILSGALTSVSASAGGFAGALSVLRTLGPIMELVPESGGEKEVVQKLKGSISLRNLSFCYTPSAPPVLDNLNLEIRQGEYVAIVGKSGCGKSTVLRLLLGFEKPDHGEILYDGRSIRSLDLTSLRRRIGTVLQDGNIFKGTIFSNLTVAAPDASMEDAWKAADLAGIGEDIRRMPLKMNTPLADGGKGVSGGQKQRLLIARALLMKPDILLFDEATSALDNVTQRAVSDALGELSCTRVVIAHRLSTVQDCDRILVLEGGRVAEEGSYDALMEKNGLFSELVKRQQI